MYIGKNVISLCVPLHVCLSVSLNLAVFFFFMTVVLGSGYKTAGEDRGWR